MLSKSERRKNIFRQTKEPSYVIDRATFLLTNKALMVARNNRQSATGVSTDVFCVPLGQIDTVALSEKKLNDIIISSLEIQFIKGKGNFLIELVSHDNRSIPELKTVETFLNRIKMSNIKWR